MDAAGAAALAPLSTAPRLAAFGEKLVALGVTDCRVLSDLSSEDPYEVVAEVLGLEGAFTEPELDLLKVFVKKINVGSAVLKRVRSADTHADDVVQVLDMQKKRKEDVADTTQDAPPPFRVSGQAHVASQGSPTGARRTWRWLTVKSETSGTSGWRRSSRSRERRSWRGPLART